MDATLTPASELSAARQDRIDGKLDERQYFAIVDRVRPQLEQATSAPALDPGMAQEGIHQLRQQRLAGKVTEAAYHQQMAQLAPLTSGETPPPVGHADPFQQQIAEVMAPAKPEDYQLAYKGGMPTSQEAAAFDGDLRAVLSESGIPKQYGGPIVDAIEEVARRLGNAPDDVRKAHEESFRSQLRAHWGADHETRVNAITALIAEAVAKRPSIAQAIDSAPWLLADLRVANYLWAVAEHRARTA